MKELIELDFFDLGAVIALMVVAIGISAWEKLGLELNLAIATVRSILQLAVLGYVLDFIFAFDSNPVAVLAILAVMLTIAAIVAKNRINQKMPQVVLFVWGSIFLSSALTIIYTNALIIQPSKWFDAQYVIPLSSLVLGNAMNAAAISGERLVKTINSSQMEIETHLSLGATPQQAVAQYRKDSIRAALLPTINQMMIIGMVTVPGFFAGQLLSGINARNAASYQIVIMFLIAFADLLTAVLLTRALCNQFFNSAAQLVNK